MGKNMKKTVKEIFAYLSNFKDAKGKEPFFLSSFSY